MGTDIHYVFQKKIQDSKSQESWETLNLDYGFHKNETTGDYEDGEYYIGRHYLLFAVIAGVRNGYGFAGSYRHEPLIPIAQRRGLPDGVRDECDRPNVPDDSDTTEYCELGDHSFTWLLGSEILNWFKLERNITMKGILNKKEYYEWDKNDRCIPESYSFGVLGDLVKIYDETIDGNLPYKAVSHLAQYDGITHVRVSWQESINESLSHFRDMIQKVVDEHGEIRMVMGFDS